MFENSLDVVYCDDILLINLDFWKEGEDRKKIFLFDCYYYMKEDEIVVFRCVGNLKKVLEFLN